MSDKNFCTICQAWVYHETKECPHGLAPSELAGPTGSVKPLTFLRELEAANKPVRRVSRGKKNSHWIVEFDDEADLIQGELGVSDSSSSSSALVSQLAQRPSDFSVE